jgi:hypothetical protein
MAICVPVSAWNDRHRLSACRNCGTKRALIAAVRKCDVGNASHHRKRRKASVSAAGALSASPPREVIGILQQFADLAGVYRSEPGFVIGDTVGTVLFGNLP